MAPDKHSPKVEDCFATVIDDFMSSANPKWMGDYSAATRAAWGRELRLAARPTVLGSVSIADIRPKLIQVFLDELEGKPGKQANALAALKALEKWAIVRERLLRPITTGVETGKSTGGHIPWSEEHVALAEQYASPEVARAITLGANTGQRKSDLVKMRWSDLEDVDGHAGINVVQQKTKRQLWVPLTPALRTAMATWQKRPGFILLRADGTPWTTNRLSDAWAEERDSRPELRPLIAVGKTAKDNGLVLHGLRGAACVRLRRLGATVMQIADVVGMSVGMVERYCRLSAQKENALAAVVHLRTFSERKIDMAGKSSA